MTIRVEVKTANQNCQTSEKKKKKKNEEWECYGNIQDETPTADTDSSYSLGAETADQSCDLNVQIRKKYFNPH